MSNSETKWAYGQIPNLTTGWAIIPFRHKPHHWKRLHANLDGEALYLSKCGLKAVTNSQVQPLNIGNYEKCQRCQQWLSNDTKHKAP